MYETEPGHFHRVSIANLISISEHPLCRWNNNSFLKREKEANKNSNSIFKDLHLILAELKHGLWIFIFKVIRTTFVAEYDARINPALHNLYAKTIEIFKHWIGENACILSFLQKFTTLQWSTKQNQIWWCQRIKRQCLYYHFQHNSCHSTEFASNLESQFENVYPEQLWRGQSMWDHQIGVKKRSDNFQLLVKVIIPSHSRFGKKCLRLRVRRPTSQIPYGSNNLWRATILLKSPVSWNRFKWLKD